MIATFVTFRYEGSFDEVKIRKIAEEARGKFEGMPDLRSKFFTVRPEKKEAVNVYIWENEQAAKRFFTKELLEMVTGLYGVRPTIEHAPVAAIVENRRS
jgi:hypothetical protein